MCLLTVMRDTYLTLLKYNCCCSRSSPAHYFVLFEHKRNIVTSKCVHVLKLNRRQVERIHYRSLLFFQRFGFKGKNVTLSVLIDFYETSSNVLPLDSMSYVPSHFCSKVVKLSRPINQLVASKQIPYAQLELQLSCFAFALRERINYMHVHVDMGISSFL